MSAAFNQERATATEPLPVIIVGAGPSGVRVAQTLSRLAPDLPVVIYGDEPWEPYNRVRLSSFLAGEVDWSGLTRDQQLPATGRVTYVHGRVVEIDRKRRQVQDGRGHWLPWSNLVLATGSRPHMPAIPGIYLAGVYTFRDLGDAHRLQARRVRSRHTVVLGGGLLGLEAARAMQRFHTNVTLVQSADRLLNRQLDKTGAELLHQQVEALGIEIILRDGIKQVLGETRVEGVLLRSGNTVSCDTVIVAVGIRPNVELARQAGLSVATGVRVDDAMRSSDPLIYAVGECAEHRGHVYGIVGPGLEQAAVAAHVITGAAAHYAGSIAATRLKVVGCPVFSMGRVGEEDALTTALRPVFQRPEQTVYRKLVVHHWRLSGAMAVGDWPELGRIQEAVTNNRRVWPWQLWRFRRTGSLWPEADQGGVADWPSETAVCNCTGVTRGRLGAALTEGCSTVEALAAATGASTVCGSCRPLLVELVGSAPPVPIRGYRSLLACVVLALLLTLAFLLPAGYSETVQIAFRWDHFWRDDFWRQFSGFTVLGLSVLGLLLSLRKRWSKLRAGDYALWRLFHALAGTTIIVLLWIHTGGRFGDQLNRLLIVFFLLLLLAGAVTGVIIGGEHRLDGATGRRLRRQSLWLHILLFWPVPVLLGFHVLKFYYF